MKVASRRPALIDSTTVGKSVKRNDSNRAVVLVRVAKSVTGHVRCQVTGKKPIFNSDESANGSPVACAFSQGL